MLRRTVILINDIPVLTRATKGRERIEESVRNYLNRRTYATPLIFSLDNSIYKPYHFERLFTSEKDYEQVELKPPTGRNLENAIKAAAGQMGIVSQAMIKDVALQSNGDIRCAKKLIEMRKRFFSARIHSSDNPYDSKGSQDECSKDYEFQTLHITGKFFYNKRKDPSTGKERFFTAEELAELNPDFYFSPQKTIDMIRLSHCSIRNLFFQNYLKFYDETDDCANQADVFATSDLIHKQTYYLNYGESELMGVDRLNTIWVGTSLMLNNLNGHKEGKKFEFRAIRNDERGYLDKVKKAREDIRKALGKVPVSQSAMLDYLICYSNLWKKGSATLESKDPEAIEEETSPLPEPTVANEVSTHYFSQGNLEIEDDIEVD
eukprot:TRINITY_DN597_c0_g2_i4.p1 TRINITY_DN597_c0_g2~~TRINITY_DN597_c0_g2_i4.p1  ORF type:complete len:377 (+),score=68.56 TRINITY_DN597_c0_g2_i4:554-1684(+)